MLNESRILTCSPFTFHITTQHRNVVENLERIYGDRVTSPHEHDGFIDYRVGVTHSGGLRRIFADQSRFTCDKLEPFKPLNKSQAFAMLEWGLNWVVAAHEVSHLIIHSAVLAKNGKAILFPAPPGSGKSTLTAFLSRNGWQLLSDEMALITPMSLKVTPFVRPICLKNKSIELVKEWYPNATFSSVARDTHKGDVIHMSPDNKSIEMQHQAAEIAGIVFPKYTSNIFCDVFSLDNATAYTQLSENAFNYSVLQGKGVKSLINIVEQVPSFEVAYNSLEELSSFLDDEVLR